MKNRTTITAGLSAVVLLFAASCGSDSTGEATSPSNTSSVSTMDTSAVQTTADAGTSTDAMTESSESESTESGGEETGGEESMVTSASPTTTVGNDSGELDADSVTWFETFCTGLKPLTDLSSMGTQNGSSSDPGSLDQVAKTIATAGTALTDTSGKLAGLPAPGFEGGADFATKSIAGLEKLGTTFTSAADKIAKGDQSGVQDLSGVMSGGELQDLAAIDATAATKAAIAKIPACKDLGMM